MSAEETEKPPCRDFDLGALETFDPRVFEGGSDTDAFVLSLALAFNDLKDLAWMFQQVSYCEPADKSVPNPQLGQWKGMSIYVTRHLIAHAHEVVNALKEADRRGVLETPEWCEALGLCPPAVIESWAKLVGTARGEPGDDPFLKFLVMVRNNVAFHYDQPKALMSAYLRAFPNPPTSAFNTHAFVSLGDRAEGCRFYFADAASGMYYDDVAEPVSRGDKMRQADQFTRTVGLALRFLVEIYIRLKAEVLALRSEE